MLAVSACPDSERLCVGDLVYIKRTSVDGVFDDLMGSLDSSSEEVRLRLAGDDG